MESAAEPLLVWRQKAAELQAAGESAELHHSGEPPQVRNMQ